MSSVPAMSFSFKLLIGFEDYEHWMDEPCYNNLVARGDYVKCFELRCILGQYVIGLVLQFER